jgi:hypothetical protein
MERGSGGEVLQRHHHSLRVQSMEPRAVPEDPNNPGNDVLKGELTSRTHYIHCVLAVAEGPLSPAEIGRRAETLARSNGYPVKPKTFSSSTTGSHLNTMRDDPERGFAETVSRGMWQLTGRARERIAAVTQHPRHQSSVQSNTPPASRSVPPQPVAPTPPPPSVLPLPEEIDPSVVLREGAVRTIVVNAYERNPEARRQCLAAHGTACCICGFNFGVVYGPEADGYIHVHHLQPLSEIGEEYVVNPVEDLRPVCPNCHAVIHIGGRCRTVDEVRKMLTK